MIADILSPEFRIRRQPTEFRVKHNFRQHTHRLLPETDRKAVRDYFDGVTLRIGDRIFGPDNDADGIETIHHSRPAEGFRIESRNSVLTIDILKIHDDQRIAFDLGILLCVPDLGIEHCALMHSRKLKPDSYGLYHPHSPYQGLESIEELYDMDRLACMMLNLHPRAGMFLFTNPGKVGPINAGWRVLSPEAYLTLPGNPNVQMIADEGMPLSHFVTDWFLSGVRGTTDRRAVDIVTNVHPELYAHVTVMLTLKELNKAPSVPVPALPILKTPA